MCELVCSINFTQCDLKLDINNFWWTLWERQSHLFSYGNFSLRNCLHEFFQNFLLVKKFPALEHRVDRTEIKLRPLAETPEVGRRHYENDTRGWSKWYKYLAGEPTLHWFLPIFSAKNHTRNNLKPFLESRESALSASVILLRWHHIYLP